MREQVSMARAPRAPIACDEPVALTGLLDQEVALKGWPVTAEAHHGRQLAPTFSVIADLHLLLARRPTFTIGPRQVPHQHGTRPTGEGPSWQELRSSRLDGAFGGAHGPASPCDKKALRSEERFGADAEVLSSRSVTRSDGPAGSLGTSHR